MDAAYLVEGTLGKIAGFGALRQSIAALAAALADYAKRRAPG